MTKYSNYNRGRSREEKEAVHPIWRGVGFIFLILAPVMGYYASLLLIEANAENGWFKIPRDILAPGADPNLYIKIGLTILMAFLIFFILQFVGILIYRIAGPERYGPMDVPPITGVKTKKSR
jgi:uncharacterized membrane protein YdbT with pleckstrin-like domain